MKTKIILALLLIAEVFIKALARVLQSAEDAIYGKDYWKL